MHIHTVRWTNVTLLNEKVGNFCKGSEWWMNEDIMQLEVKFAAWFILCYPLTQLLQ